MNIIKEITSAQNRLVYRLTSTVIDSITAYGIMVTTTLFGDEETEYIEFVTADLDFGEKLLGILADNTVLPSTLKEVVSEFIAGYFTVLCRLQN